MWFTARLVSEARGHVGMSIDPDGGRYRAAFSSCRTVLEQLARASNESGRLAARTWWVACMGSNLESCRNDYDKWRSEAAAVLPPQLTAQHTEQAVSLSGFEPMARCVISSAALVGVQPDRTLEHVEAEGMKQQAAAEWTRATAEVEPLRSQLQTTFLKGGGGFFLSRDKPRLAASASAMEIDELRVCQIFAYSLAARLGACRNAAAEFAEVAGMRGDGNAPLLGYDEDKWDPNAPVWQRMEMCVHRAAEGAGEEFDRAWRRGPL